MKSPYRCRPSDGVTRRLQDWFHLPLGQLLSQAESELLASVLPNLFGYHLLQVGCPDTVDLLSSSRITHHMVLKPDADGGRDGSLCGSPAALPFASESLDVVVLPHVLEFDVEPHQVLRETDRVLIPEGHVVILGFNPLSLWGMWRLMAGWRGNVPWCGRFLTPRRTRDWLALLGFDILQSRSVFFRPPLQRQGVLRRLEFMERGGGVMGLPVGGVYLLLARKRLTTLTPIRPRWQPKRAVVPPGLVEPTTRG